MTNSNCRVSEHVKNYRPKLLLLSGPPSSRPSLIHFANLITKKISLLSTTHIVKEPDIDWSEVDTLRTSAQEWCLRNKVVSWLTFISLSLCPGESLPCSDEKQQLHRGSASCH